MSPPPTTWFGPPSDNAWRAESAIAAKVNARLTDLPNHGLTRRRYPAPIPTHSEFLAGLRAVLFLLNDMVLDLEPAKLVSPRVAGHLAKLSSAQVSTLVREVFAHNPRMPASHLQLSRRAAVMLVMKNPELNAALFLTPGRVCEPDDVTVRFATLAVEVMVQLKTIQDQGRLTPGAVNALVWSRAGPRAGAG